MILYIHPNTIHKSIHKRKFNSLVRLLNVIENPVIPFLPNRVTTTREHTHPDIEFAVGMISQFMYVPTEECFEVTYQVLKYLKGSPDKRSLFKKNCHAY